MAARWARGHDGLNGLLQLFDEGAVVNAFGGADAKADSPELRFILLNHIALHDAQIIAVQQVVAVGL